MREPLIADIITSVRGWDHPRVCGNHEQPEFGYLNHLGSPPRVREPHCCRVDVFARNGITPACAGTTSLCSSVSSSHEDHPRVCGNHHWKPLQRIWPAGSPPRVREPLTAKIGDGHSHGITPACAGTTHRFFAIMTADGDHPRVCGNHPRCLSSAIASWGSPPRVREPPY